MASFVPTENDLVVNPITGKTVVGKNVDSYESKDYLLNSKFLIVRICYIEFINDPKTKNLNLMNDQYYNRMKDYSKELHRRGKDNGHLQCKHFET